jgi:hypothetical protein
MGQSAVSFNSVGVATVTVASISNIGLLWFQVSSSASDLLWDSSGSRNVQVATGQKECPVGSSERHPKERLGLLSVNEKDLGTYGEEFKEFKEGSQNGQHKDGSEIPLFAIRRRRAA